MQELYILRHGIAVPQGTPGYADDERPLTEKGKRQLRKVARGLRRLKLQPDRIVSSPLPRARRTAEIVSKVFKRDDPIEMADVLGVAGHAGAIRDWLQGRSEKSLMIVGHNPILSDLVGLLATGSSDLGAICDLKKGGLAAFQADESGRLRLDWLATPWLIQRLARRR